MYRDSLNETRYNPKVIRKTADATFLAPTKWKESKLIFTSSLTDFFHEGCDSFRDQAWEVIRKCPQHTFQILTKRPERISEHLPEFWQEIKDRVWLGTSVGSKSGLHRIEHLLESGADCLYFLSIEPLYEDLELPLWHKAYRLYAANNATFYHDMIGWVIVGGESGNENGLYKYRPCKLEWIEQIVNQCKEANIPVFVKQLGTHLAKELGVQKFTIDDIAHNNRHGTMIESFPESIQFQEMPIEANRHLAVWKESK